MNLTKRWKCAGGGGGGGGICVCVCVGRAPLYSYGMNETNYYSLYMSYQM